MKLYRVLLVALLLILQGCSMLSPSDPRTAKQQWLDQQIEMEVGGIANKPPFLQQSRINAFALEGKVLLVGQAVDQATRQQLVDKVRTLANVETVYDQVQIRPLPQLSEVSKDSWITTKVKSQLIGSKKLTDVSVSVVTEAQEVFLLGYVTREQGNIAAEIARNVSGVKKVVKVFEYPQSQ
ncbi:21 kDa hemolysin precursor [Photobacterium marinum]|uniref:21 kDa hemolysin n=2 Tax=Photobacterium TaxID=657 RepID=L8JFT6_9GAMM|nr:MULTISPECIES: BON domain-containing protein [Photobacterium]ELR66369.1 21 kDa hemolysin precursor [Photobacterium marinum]